MYMFFHFEWLREALVSPNLKIFHIKLLKSRSIILNFGVLKTFSFMC